MAADRVVTIYFCGTGSTSEWWNPAVSLWNNPELIASLYHRDNSWPIEKVGYHLGDIDPTLETEGQKSHYKYIVDGIGTGGDFWSLLGQADPDFGPRGWEALTLEAVKAISLVLYLNPEDGVILNLVGWSRGGVLCLKTARYLAAAGSISKINILAFDPVPGVIDPVGRFGDDLVLPARVNQYIGVYAQDERSYMFEPVIPTRESASTDMWLVSVPGSHETMMGNWQPDGHSRTPLDPFGLIDKAIDIWDWRLKAVSYTTEGVADQLLPSWEWGNVPLADPYPDDKNTFLGNVSGMYQYNYAFIRTMSFLPFWSTYDGCYNAGGVSKDHNLRIIWAFPVLHGRLSFVAQHRHSPEWFYVWYCFLFGPLYFSNPDQVYWLDGWVPKMDQTAWDRLQYLRGSPPPDTEPPVPTLVSLPDITGECAATITSPPTATDTISGTVPGTTTDPLTYTEQGMYTLTWTYADRSGNASTQTQTVIVADTRPPTPNVDPLDTVQGQCSVRISTTPVAIDNCSGTVNATTGDPLNYAEQGTYQVRWTYNDGKGNTATQLQSVTVKDTIPPMLVAPLGIEKPADPGKCSAVVSYDVTAADNCAVSLVTNPPSHSVFPKGTTTVTATARDVGGNTEIRTFPVTVEDKELPQISAPSNVIAYIKAGEESWKVLVNDETLGAAAAGDNCSEIVVTRTGVPSDNFFPVGMTAITYTAKDAAGNTATATQLVTVIDNIGPITSNLDATPNPVSVGATVALAAALDDSKTGRSNIASAEYSLDGGQNWSPMSASGGNLDSPVEDVTITIGAFSNAGVYAFCVRGTDIYRNTGDKACILLAVYDPEGGFVTGGGWLISPTGAYTAEPSLTGKATFGFVSKYQRGATVPTGQTEFQFKVANLNFHSDTYEWLVVAGARAQYKGSGTINGAGDYGFMLTAFDGQISGSGGTDRFRIKIWNKDTDTMVYDNQIGSSDVEDPTTTLGGGSIVIHKE